MSGKTDNPFAGLNGLFPDTAVKRVPDGRTNAARQPAGKSRNGPGFQGSQEETGDTALFLDAVGTLRPVKAGKHTGHKLADVLDRSLNGNRKQAPPMTGKKKKSMKAQPAAEQAAPVSRAGAEQGEGRARAEQRPGTREEELFTKAMQGVRPVHTRGREVAPGAARTPGRGAAPDPAKALRDLLEGRVEFAVHHSDEYLEGHVVGVDPKLLDRLRSGQLSPEANLDLHGQNARQAFEALTWFMKNAYQRNLRTVLVVTGRGKNSPDGMGVLRPLLQQWLCRDPFKRVVLAFCSAKPSDGGPGAVYVLLRKYKKSRGKIMWERTISDDDFSY